MSSLRMGSFALLSALLLACGGDDGGGSTDADVRSSDASVLDDPEAEEPLDADMIGAEVDAGGARDSAVRDAARSDASAIGDGAVSRVDAGSTARDAGAGDAGLASNTPWAPFVWTSTAPRDGLTMIASNIKLEQVGSAVSVEWLFVIRNGGTRPVCSAIVRGAFVNAAGTEILKVIGTTDSSPYLDTGATAVVKCMPPGSSVGGYANTAIAAAVDLKLAKELQYSVTGVTQATAVLQTSPMLTSSKITSTAAGTAVEGSVVNGARAVRFLSYKLYPLDARGMPLKRLMVYQSTETNDLFPANTSWNFTSESQAEPFSTYLLNLDFQF